MIYLFGNLIHRLLSPDPEIGEGGYESGGSEEGGRESGGGRDYSGNGEQDDEERERIIYTGSSKINPNTYNILENKLYNTISCPCSSYAVELDNGNIGCEIDNFGVLKSINPISINNHFISNKIPKVGDKWRCIKIKCEQDGFKWDTLHVVKVEEKLGQASSSLFNSISSTSNCYIPSSTLQEYGEINVLNEPFIVDGVDINDPKEFINGKPLFKTSNSAEIYNSIRGQGIISSEYNDNGVIKYFPGEYYPEEKLITNCMVGKESMLKYMHEHNWIYKSYASETHKIMVDSRGGAIHFKVFGKNKPEFTITIKDSSGCSILDKKIKNEVLESDVYNLKQVFPSLPQGKTSETYDFTLTPSADSSYYYNRNLVRAGIIKAKIWQFKNPTFTFTSSTSSIVNTAQVSPSVTVAGKPNTRSQNTSGLTHTYTLSRFGGSSDNYYVKSNSSLKFSDLTTQDTWIKKTIVKEDEDGIPCVNSFKAIDTHTYKGDIEIGMRFTGKVEKTKTIRKSIDLDIHKEPCDDCDENTDIKTNKFEIGNTTDLFRGMKVVGANFETYLESVDCEKSITLASEHVIDINTDITFSHTEVGTVRDIKGDLIETNCVRFPNNTELTFTKGDKPKIDGRLTFDKSGSSSIVVTSVINYADFGQEDITFTLNPDLFITNKPNACDQHITIGKNSVVNIDFTKCDTDYNRHNKTIIAVDNFKNGTITKLTNDYTYSYTPNTDFVGKDRLVFNTRDDASNNSDEKTIFITVK